MGWIWYANCSVSGDKHITCVVHEEVLTIWHVRFFSLLHNKYISKYFYICLLLPVTLLHILLFQWSYFEFKQLYSQWQASKDSSISSQWRLRKCNPYFIRPRLRCKWQMAAPHLTLMHNFLYMRLIEPWGYIVSLSHIRTTNLTIIYSRTSPGR